MRLIINWYNDTNPERLAEYVNCLQRNCQNEYITEIITVGDESPAHPKITNILTSYRPMFIHLFEKMGNGINIIANTDIYFDETLSLARPSVKEVYALTRWDVDKVGNAMFFNRADSQDVWIFNGKTECKAAFSIGMPGCDNSLVHMLDKAGYEVSNPSLNIKAYHLHNSEVRNYSNKKPSDRVPPPYKLLPPHELRTWVSDIHKQKGGVYSQFDEDAIIDFVFANIGTTNKYLVDLGAGAYDGKMSNTKRLIESGWNGYGVDMTETKETFIINRFIEPDTILDLMAEQKTPRSFDLLNLDIDSSDYWVLKNILSKYKPRLIVTEFNGCLHPYIPVALEYEKGYTWDGTDKYGYSFKAGFDLLESNGYRVIYNQHDTNIFAVLKELVPETIVQAKKNQYHPHNPNAKFIAV